MDTKVIWEKFKSLNSETKILIAFIAASTIVLVSYGTFSLMNILSTGEEFSQEEKAEIYQKIIANNPQSILEDQAKQVEIEEVIQNALTDPFTSIEDTPENSSETIYGKLEEVNRQLDEIANRPPSNNAVGQGFLNSQYNYSYSKQIYTTGHAFEECNALNSTYEGGYGQYYITSNSTDGIVEFYDYSDPYQKYYYKSKATNTNLNLLKYNLSRRDSDENSYLVFAEGDYALRSNYPIYQFSPPSYPVSYTNTPYVPPGDLQQIMEYYFGKGINIDGTVNKNGKTYIQLSRKIQGMCNWDPESVNYFQPKAGFVNVYLVNESDYSISSTAVYLETIADNNLVWKRDNSIERRLVNNFNEIENMFNYEYSKPITDLQYQEEYYSYEESRPLRIQALQEFIVRDNLNLLVPDLNHFKLEYLSTDSILCYTDWCNLYYNRAFFPSSDLGDDMYNAEINRFKSDNLISRPLASLYFRNKHHTNSHDIQINLYANSQSETKIINSGFFHGQFGQVPVQTKGAVNLLINNQLNGGNYLELETVYSQNNISYPVSYLPVSHPVSYTQGHICIYPICFNKNGKIILGYRDSNYLINYFGDRREYLSDLTYKTLDPSNSQDLGTITQLLQNIY